MKNSTATELQAPTVSFECGRIVITQIQNGAPVRIEVPQDPEEAERFVREFLGWWSACLRKQKKRYAKEEAFIDRLVGMLNPIRHFVEDDPESNKPEAGKASP